MDNEKVYFMPGDVVTIKQDIPNKPIMLVIKKETVTFRNDKEPSDFFKGIRCRWFTKDGMILEAIFNTKDIIKHECR